MPLQPYDIFHLLTLNLNTIRLLIPQMMRPQVWKRRPNDILLVNLNLTHHKNILHSKMVKRKSIFPMVQPNPRSNLDSQALLFCAAFFKTCKTTPYLGLLIRFRASIETELDRSVRCCSTEEHWLRFFCSEELTLNGKY